MLLNDTRRRASERLGPALWIGLTTLLVLVGLNIIAWVVYQHAFFILDRELDQRLLATGRAAAPFAETLLAEEDEARLTAFLSRLRESAHLEHAFVFDSERRSLGDARPARRIGTRYDPLRLDPIAVEESWGGAPTVSPDYEIEGHAFKGAYVPLRGPNEAITAILYLESSVEFVEALSLLRRVLLVAGGISVVLALLIGATLSRGVISVTQAAESRARLAHLAVMGRVAAEAAHEIKNPLAIMQASAQLLEEQETFSSNGHDLVQGLREEIARVNTLVRDFLSLSPNIALTRDRHTLRALLEPVITQLARTNGTAFEVMIPEELPDLSVDAGQMRQVFLNVILNAVQATQGEGVIQIASRRTDDRLMVEILDDGPGMDKHTLSRAFDPFFSGRPDGTGLGLAVARRIIESHGGTLELRSKRDQGTRVVLALPLDTTAP